MKDLKDICFIIQARTNSSRLPGKMIKPFAESSLIEISIDNEAKIKLNKNYFVMCYGLTDRQNEL